MALHSSPPRSPGPRAKCPDLVSLKGKGWCVVGTCVAVVGLRRYGGEGFAVGVQDRLRHGGVGRVWSSLSKARRRAAELSAINRLPIVESI